MYFENFESYGKFLDEAKTFRVDVTYSSGSKDFSSDIPISELKAVLTEIVQCEENSTTFYMWNHTTKAIFIIPFHAIQSIRVVVVS